MGYSAGVLAEEYSHMMEYISHFGKLIRVVPDTLSDFIYIHIVVPGLLARDLSKMAEFINLWYQSQAKTPAALIEKELPVALIFPTESGSQENTLQSTIVNDMVRDFENLLGLKARRVSVSSLWDEKSPPEAEGQSLHIYMKDVCFD